MRQIYRSAFDALKKAGVPVYEHADDDGNFSINAESAQAQDWVSYYSELVDWDLGMNPKLLQILDHHRMYAEWVNPGRLSVYFVE
jgi:hypothetical protein